MRASCGCPVEDGMTLHGFHGPCLDERSEMPQPTTEDYCAMGGHGYAGDDGDSGRCYCGRVLYQPGGAPLDLEQGNP